MAVRVDTLGFYAAGGLGQKIIGPQPPGTIVFPQGLIGTTPTLDPLLILSGVYRLILVGTFMGADEKLPLEVVLMRFRDGLPLGTNTHLLFPAFQVTHVNLFASLESFHTYDFELTLGTELKDDKAWFQLTLFLIQNW